MEVCAQKNALIPLLIRIMYCLIFRVFFSHRTQTSTQFLLDFPLDRSIDITFPVVIRPACLVWTQECPVTQQVQEHFQLHLAQSANFRRWVDFIIR